MQELGRQDDLLQSSKAKQYIEYVLTGWIPQAWNV